MAVTLHQVMVAVVVIAIRQLHDTIDIQLPDMGAEVATIDIRRHQDMVIVANHLLFQLSIV